MKEFEEPIIEIIKIENDIIKTSNEVFKSWWSDDDDKGMKEDN